MGGVQRMICGLLRGAGGSLLGMGGFPLDEHGQLIEVYDDTEEDWPEERVKSGDESQDSKDLGWTDCIWRHPECDRA